MSPMEIADRFGDKFFMKKGEDKGSCICQSNTATMLKFKENWQLSTENGVILWCTAMVK